MINKENALIRDELLSSATKEAAKGPFNLKGKGSEARLTLDRSLAGILRNVKLPRVYISGFGANYYYPERIFLRALESLKKKLGYAPFEITSNGEAYRVRKDSS